MGFATNVKFWIATECSIAFVAFAISIAIVSFNCYKFLCATTSNLLQLRTKVAMLETQLKSCNAMVFYAL